MRVSKKNIRFGSNMSLDEGEQGESDEPLEQTDDQNMIRVDPDAYKEDWKDSLIYKRSMKAEAIKRGKPYADFEVPTDAEMDFDVSTV